MKNKLLFLSINLLLIFNFSFAQNVKLETQIIETQRTNYSDGFGFGDPDPTWIIKGYIGGALQGTSTLTFEEMSGTNWNVGYNGCTGPVPCSIVNNSNTSATSFTLGLDAWDNDCDPMNTFESGCNCVFGICANSDKRRCTSNSLNIVNFRTAAAFCVSSNSSGWTENWSSWCGSYRVKYAYRWSFASSPTITSQPTTNASLCLGFTTNLSVSVNTDASSGVSLGQHYQWQVSNSTACNGSNWQDIPSATSSTYTPPQIAGTRLYRVKVTSNCTANFSSLTTTSNCSRVTYNPMNGATSGVTGGFPYGTGDNAPAIQSGVCGSTVLPSSSHLLSTLQPPAIGAIANISSYIWSISGGGTISSTSGSSVTYTAPSSPGTSTVTLTYVDACGAANASVVCIINVGSPSCDIVYVSPSGSDVAANGGPSNPYATLAYGIAQRGSRTHVKMTNNSFTESQTVELADNLVIEGGYTIVGGLWEKSSNSSTSINVNDGTSTVSGSANHFIGFRSSGDDNWKLIDLTITTSNKTGNRSGERGDNNYGLHISSSSGYEIIRTNISSGNAGNGGNGTGWGDNGANGLTGFNGSNGSCDGSHGNGGSGRTGPGSGTRKGGNSGAGGRGGTEGCNTGVNGSDGSNGGGGASGDNTQGNGGGGGRPGGSGGNASSSISTTGGSSGSAGTSYSAGNRPTNYSFGTYFSPATRSANGGDGGGGGGGAGGGGGGGNAECGCCWCVVDDGGGNGAGAGGTGGEGGQGGRGAWGAGGSFGVYVSGTTGTFINSIISSGSAGTGGTGQGGGSGSSGANGGSGASACTGEVGRGGNGSRGGNGAAGGRGRDGANGVASAYATSSGTATSPSSSIPNSPILTINYENAKICKYSVLNIEKTAGSWGLPSGWSFVKYNNTGVSSEYSISSSPADITTTNSSGIYDLTASGVVFDSYLDVMTDRPLPVITINANDGSTLSPAATICNDGTVQLTASTSAQSGGTEVEFKWEIFDNSTQAPNKGLTSGLLFSSTIQSPVTSALVNIGTTDKTYTVRYQVREECCGWSIPVFTTIVVKPDPTAPTALVQDPSNLEVCVGQTLTVNTPSGATNGIPTYVYEYNFSNASNSTSYGISVPSFSAELGSNKVNVRVQEIALKGCDESPGYEVEWTAYKDPEPGSVLRLLPVTEEACVGTSISVQVTGGDGGVPGTIDNDIEYILVTPSGGAAPSGSGTTYSGVFTSLVGDYYFRTRRTSTGLDCNTSSWSAYSKTFIIFDNSEGGNVTDNQILCLNELADSVFLTGFTDNVIRWEIDNNSSFTTPANIDTSLIANNDTLNGSFMDSEIGTTSGIYYVRAIVGNNVCPNEKSDSILIRYNKPDEVTTVPSSLGTCTSNGVNTWVHLFGSNDRIIASIDDDGNNMGDVSVSVPTIGNASASTVCQNGMNAYMGRYYSFSSTNTGWYGNDVKVRLYFTVAELNSLIAASHTTNTAPASDTNGCEDDDDVNSLADVVATKYATGFGPGGPGGTFISQFSSGFDSDFNAYYVDFKVDGFSDIYLHGSESGVALPVELVDFKVKAIDNKFIQLNWTTATEINNEGFNIERSIDGIHFEKIGFISGNGNSNIVNYYSYQDNDVKTGTYYYRLKQIDFDGASEYSVIKNASILNEEKLSLGIFIPNPAEDFTSLDFIISKDSSVEIVIFDDIGRKIVDKTEFLTKGSNNISFNTKDFSAGIYTAKIIIDNEEYIRKLVIRK